MAKTSELISSTFIGGLLIAIAVFVAIMLLLRKPLISEQAPQAAASPPLPQDQQAASADPRIVPVYAAYANYPSYHPAWFGLNRDPVCYGDPACRDAYFRDWPYARRPGYRRPDSYYDRPRQPPYYPPGDPRFNQPITITVTSPSTSTSTATVTPAIMNSAGQQTSTEPAPEDVVVSSSAPIMPESIAPTVEVVSGVSDSEAVITSGMLAEPSTAPEPVAAEQDAAPSAGAARPRCRNAMSCGARPSVFPPTMEMGAYML
jgi:hypothetical protein